MFDKTEEVLELAKNGNYKTIESLLYDSEGHVSAVETFESVIASGRRIYVPEPCELVLDLDSYEAFTKARKAVDLFETVNHISIFSVLHKSKTEGHWHVVLTHDTFKSLSMLNRIHLQALFGSDPVKELLSMFREKSEVTYPILLFNVPGLALTRITH